MPGNFHISSHVSQDIIVSLAAQGHIFDFSYKINHVSFGRDEDFKAVVEKFSNLGVLNPIDGKSLQASYDSYNKPLNLKSNYYLIAVPSFFFTPSGEGYMVH